MKSICLLFVSLLLLLSFSVEEKPVKVFIAGDSTAQTYQQEKDGLIRGWGQRLDLFLDQRVAIENRAIGGRSTKTFINEGRWDQLVTDIAAGDYVFIQFGHNDASTRPERHTPYDEYRKNLVKMITDVRNAGGNPVLLTSVVMRTFKDGNLYDDRLKGYPVITREVAKIYSIPLIDVNLRTRDFITMLGDEDSKEYYRWVEPGIDSIKLEGIQDDTHMMDKGALYVARIIVEEIKELQLPGLFQFLK